VVMAVKVSRLRWAGHIVRMQDNLPCKKVTLDKPEGRRRAGRLNLRWTDGVMKITLKESITLCVYQYVEVWVRQTQQLMYYSNTISWKNTCITIV
jgi:hypothetical protein